MRFKKMVIALFVAVILTTLVDAAYAADCSGCLLEFGGECLGCII